MTKTFLDDLNPSQRNLFTCMQGYFYSLRDTHKAMVELQKELDGWELEIPQWEESFNSELIYTSQYQLTSRLVRLNNLFSSFHADKAGYASLINDNLNTETFPQRVTIDNMTRKLMDIMIVSEKALSFHKDSLDRQMKLLQNISYLQNAERYRVFNGG